MPRTKLLTFSSRRFAPRITGYTYPQLKLDRPRISHRPAEVPQAEVQGPPSGEQIPEGGSGAA